VSVVRPKAGRIDLADIARMITPQTRLIAVSLVSSYNGFEYDLAELCGMAHGRGVLVYADIVQAAGAVPVDVKASEVDFACCGTYKWLMGDFGVAFLYVRPDRLDRLKRVDVGWRQVRRQDADPARAPGDYALASGAVGLFEVSTPAWEALAIVSASLDYVQGLGVAAIARHRQPLIDRLQDTLPSLGLQPLTPTGSRSPVLAFAAKDASKRFDARLRAERIGISTYDDRIRISPSVYNTAEDIDRLISALKSA
jgi:selenocysteine lyase/cysteine desulfurase